MVSAPATALLISGDVRFIEAAEAGLKAAWPQCKVVRAHPGGDPAVPKLALSQRGALAVQDIRFRLRAEIAKMIAILPEEGGRTVVVGAVPRGTRELEQLHADDRFDLLSHNLGWDSPRIAQAIAAACNDGGLAGLSLPSSEPKASGSVEIRDPKLKSQFVVQLAEELGGAGVQRTRRGKIASVVDELLMNALYHAPKHAGGAPLTQARWSVDAKGAFRATVTDAFGTYTRLDAHRKLVTYSANEMVEITQASGRGGGVGLFLVFRVSSEYHLYVEPGRKTEISIRIETAGKSLQGLGKNEDGRKAKREILTYFAAE